MTESTCPSYRQCAVCGQQVVTSAPVVCKCAKVVYCGSQHQKLHWENHQEDCFPGSVEKNATFGRFMLATRDIAQGELIFSEEPLVTGPGPTSSVFPLCLGCYKHVTTDYSCTKCKWPVCNEHCENLQLKYLTRPSAEETEGMQKSLEEEQVPPLRSDLFWHSRLEQHAANECKILATNAIPAAKQAIQYICINVLRCLLLRSREPMKWARIMDLESHCLARLCNPDSMRVFGLVWRFIEEKCNLQDFDAATIRHVLGAIEVNIHHFTDCVEDAGFCREGQFLYHKLSRLSHSCTPNTIWRRSETAEAKFAIVLYASVPIRKGEQIFNKYANILEDTMSRQKFLKNGYYFQCQCPRCLDPTEFGTYFSAIKCPQCPTGYILPHVESVEETEWKCSECSCKKSHLSVQTLLLRLARDFRCILQSSSDPGQKIKLLDKFITFLKLEVVHPNFSLVFYFKQEMLNLLNQLTDTDKSISLETPQERFELLKKYETMCQSLLQIIDKLFPGFSIVRGRVLYHHITAKLRCFHSSSSKDSQRSSLCTKTFYDDILSLEKQVSNNLQFGPSQSDTEKMATQLQIQISSFLQKNQLQF